MIVKLNSSPSIQIEIPSEKTTAIGINSCISFVNGFFNTNNPCYDSEKKMADQLTSEALDMAGEVCDWYQIDYSLYNERVFGEDNDRRVRSMFRVKLYFELPDDNRQYTKFGIEATDIFQVHVGKLAWNHYVKKADLEGYTPKYGDVFRPHYSGIFYEVVDVKDTDSQFLNTQHSWVMTAKVWENPMLRSWEEGEIWHELKQTTDQENAIVEQSPEQLTDMREYLKNGSDTLAQNYKQDLPKKDDPFNLNW